MAILIKTAMGMVNGLTWLTSSRLILFVYRRFIKLSLTWSSAFKSMKMREVEADLDTNTSDNTAIPGERNKCV